MRVAAACTIMYIVLPLITLNGKRIITNKIGSISFYERDWQHSYTLDLKTYVQNAWVLRNTTHKIAKRCAMEPLNGNCAYFEKHLQTNAEIVASEVDLITNNRRRKRSFWGSLLGGIIKQVLTFAGAYVIADTIYSSKLDELETKVQTTEIAMAKLMNITVMQNGLIIMNSENLIRLQENSDSANRALENQETFNDLLIARQTLIQHNKDTLKYTNIVKGDFRANFFNIIAFDTFTDRIGKITLALENNGRLPTTNPYELLDVSELSHSQNNTHVVIHVKSPIVSNEPFTLYEYVPLPIKAENALYILDSEAKLFFRDEKNLTRAISTKYVTYCRNVGLNIICNSMTLDLTHLPDECMLDILANEEGSMCAYRKIIYQNYLIRLEANTIYYVIVNPIKLRITCELEQEIFDLSSDQKLSYNDQCQMHKVTDELKYDIETFSTTEINIPQFSPNFSVYDKSNEKWTENVQLVDKYMVKIEALLNSTNSTDESIQLFKNTGYNVKKINIFEKIWSAIDPFKDLYLLSKILIAFLCTVVLIFIAITLLKLKNF